MKTKAFRILCAGSAVCSLLMLSSCDVHVGNQHADVPWYVIAIPTVIFLAIVFTITGYCLKKHTYKCPECSEEFHPKLFSSAILYSNGQEALLKCPKCKKRSYCRKTD